MLLWTASFGIDSQILDNYSDCHTCICLFLSTIGYCNSLLFGSTHDVTSHLQQILNYAARVILRLPMSFSITTHLKSLHWLPVKVRSTYKIACLCYHYHSSTAPSYVADMLHIEPSHTRDTHSSSYTIPLLTVRQHLVIACFLLLLLSGTLIEMMSGVPHHCHHLCLVWRHTCFVHFTKNEPCLWSLYICAFFDLIIAMLTAYLENAVRKEKSQIN